jgi:hypothetical protein
MARQRGLTRAVALLIPVHRAAQDHRFIENWRPDPEVVVVEREKDGRHQHVWRTLLLIAVLGDDVQPLASSSLHPARPLEQILDRLRLAIVIQDPVCARHFGLRAFYVFLMGKKRHLSPTCKRFFAVFAISAVHGNGPIQRPQARHPSRPMQVSGDAPIVNEIRQSRENQILYVTWRYWKTRV